MAFPSGMTLSYHDIKLIQNKKKNINIQNWKRNIYETCRNSGKPYLEYNSKLNPGQFQPNEASAKTLKATQNKTVVIQL